jgi:nitroreductase
MNRSKGQHVFIGRCAIGTIRPDLRPDRAAVYKKCLLAVWKAIHIWSGPNQNPYRAKAGANLPSRSFSRDHVTPKGQTIMLLEKLNWRYATKKMDPEKKVPQEKVDAILEAARLAPTSSGLQPYEIIVVSDPDKRARIRDVAWDQAQVTEGSHLLVFAAWDNYTEDRINMMFDLVNEERGVTNEGWEAYRQKLLGAYVPRDADVNYEHAARQAYIGLGIALTAAAFENVDATPMEGFDADKVDEILGLRARGLRSLTLVPLGYRETEGDWLVKLKKVRRPKEDFVSVV